MNKNYLLVSGIIFGIVACAHLARVIFGWQMLIDSWTIPLWFSWVGFIGAGALSLWAFKQMKK